jgi:tetratricopeptide (TPR) repeat protein
MGGGADADLLARELESRFKLYNTFFHFNPQSLGGERLKVRAYKSQQAYDTYISERLDKTYPGAVYLHYNQPDRRELVIHRGSPEESRILPHQAFVQYLRAFIPYPPAWFREGFAIYFSTLKFDPGSNAPNAGGIKAKTAPVATNGGLVYEENLDWLESVKSLGNKVPPIESTLQVPDDPHRGLPLNFQGVSWALASFLKDSGKGDYLRILFECFMILDSTASAQHNTEAVLNHIKSWVDLATMDKDYKAYLNSRKTFTELITDGQKAYTAKNTAAAETAFLEALKQKSTHYAPYYYLGLLAYDRKNYEEADQYYRSAQQYGADAAQVSYALGINAASAGHYAEAITFLEQAKAANPTQYNEQVDNLIKRLR